MFYILFETASIVTYVVINDRLGLDSEKVKLWTKNFEEAKDGACGKLDMTFALQNACLMGCAQLTMLWAMFVAQTYRMIDN